jgi:hypothetical protein
MLVAGVRLTSARARHKCFAIDASVSVNTAETAEMDEKELLTASGRTRSLPGACNNGRHPASG